VLARGEALRGEALLIGEPLLPRHHLIVPAPLRGLIRRRRRRVRAAALRRHEHEVCAAHLAAGLQRAQLALGVCDRHVHLQRGL